MVNFVTVFSPIKNSFIFIDYTKKGKNMNIAILTGATGGVGGEYLELLKKEQLDEIWIIARRREKLEELASSDKRIRPFPLDLTDTKSFEALASSLKEKNPTIKYLINNAGFGTIGAFDSLPAEKLTACVELNAVALTHACSICLPYMTEGSGIINVASISSFAPNPKLAVYSATKAYVKSLSHSLREELKARKINVLAVCPGPMKTEFLSVAGIEKGVSSMFDTLPSTPPSKVARCSLNALKKGRAIYTPGILFKFYRIISALIPHSIIVKLTKV